MNTIQQGLVITSCEGYHILPLYIITLEVLSSEDTTFTPFFFTIGSTGLACHKEMYQSLSKNKESLMSEL